jgi:hypothetical protein
MKQINDLVTSMKPKFTVIFSISAVTLQSMWLKCIISNYQFTIGYPLVK